MKKVLKDYKSQTNKKIEEIKVVCGKKIEKGKFNWLISIGALLLVTSSAILLYTILNKPDCENGTDWVNSIIVQILLKHMCFFC